MAGEDSTVRNNEAAHHYELERDGKVAFVDYQRHGNSIIFTHTEVPEALEGQGIGSLLARAVLDDARKHGLSVVPLCPFVRGYIDRHPEYQSLVARGGRP